MGKNTHMILYEKFLDSPEDQLKWLILYFFLNM